MTITAESLSEPTQLGVRIVGRELLNRLREKSEHLGSDDHPDALHDFRVAVRRLRSWVRAFDDDLSATVRPKAQRRLKRIADATRASRDFEVHIDWLDRFARSRKGRYREATEWLVERARDRKARADLELQEMLNENLERTIAQLTHGLSHYVVSLDEPSDRFSATLAELDSGARGSRAPSDVENRLDRRPERGARSEDFRQAASLPSRAAERRWSRCTAARRAIGRATRRSRRVARRADFRERDRGTSREGASDQASRAVENEPR